MKTGAMAMVLGFCTLLAGATALADDNRSRGRGLDGGWRLGHERIQGGYSIYHRSGAGWHRMPGAAIDVAEGWVIGTQREDGGFAIYRWNGHGWDQAPGGAVRIGGSYRQPWVVNNRGQRFVWNGYDWRPDYGFGDRRGVFQRTIRNRHEAAERQHNIERGRRRGNW